MQTWNLSLLDDGKQILIFEFVVIVSCVEERFHNNLIRKDIWDIMYSGASSGFQPNQGKIQNFKRSLFLITVAYKP